MVVQYNVMSTMSMRRLRYQCKNCRRVRHHEFDGGEYDDSEYDGGEYDGSKYDGDKYDGNTKNDDDL